MPHNEFQMSISETEPVLVRGDILLVPVFQQEDSLKLPESLTGMVQDPEGLIEEASRRSFKGAYKKSLNLLNWPLPETHLIIVGCGKVTALNSLRLMTTIQAALVSIPDHTDRVIAFMDGLASARDHVSADSQAIATSTALSYHLYRSREFSGTAPSVKELILSRVPDGSTESVVDRALAMNRAASRARDLVNMPPNVKRTLTLAAEARTIAGTNLEVDIQEDVNWIEENMPCFYTVARGSVKHDPPRWIHLKLANPAARRRVALVGKSVIFDTGGYQIKPDGFMNTMKADMTGGATVLSVMDAIRDLNLNNLEVHAFMAATPNLVNDEAMLPDSIVDTTCGKKVEIRHTDAEGRLTLIDAVTMAERTEPDVILTVATLTGSATRAVGPHIALMSRHREWRDRLESAGRTAADLSQPLEILEEDFEDIASKLDGADINNTGNKKYRGAQTAAAFVMSGLTKDTPLLHLDIAGGDMSEDDKATGIACRSIIQFLVDLNLEVG